MVRTKKYGQNSGYWSMRQNLKVQSSIKEMDEQIIKVNNKFNEDLNKCNRVL
jgi:hypothetical protein